MRKDCRFIQPLAIRFCAFVLALTAGIVLHNVFRSAPSTSDASETLIIGAETVVPKTSILEIDCGRHGERMNMTYVSILTGSPGYLHSDKTYQEAKLRFFPNSNFFIVDGDRSVTEGHAQVYYCSRCRAAEREWLRQHDLGQIRITIPH